MSLHMAMAATRAMGMPDTFAAGSVYTRLMRSAFVTFMGKACLATDRRQTGRDDASATAGAASGAGRVHIACGNRTSQ